MKLLQKLLLLSVVPFIIIMSAIMLMNRILGETIVRNSVSRYSDLELASYGTRVESFFQTRINELDRLAFSDQVQTGNTYNIMIYLNREMGHLSQMLENLYFQDLTGKIYTLPGVDADTELVYFPKKTPNELAFTQVFTSPISNLSVVGMVIPVFNEQGQHKGAIGCNIKIKSLIDMVDEITMGSSGFAMLIDNDDRIINNFVDPEQISFLDNQFVEQKTVKTGLDNLLERIHSSSDGAVPLLYYGKSYEAYYTTIDDIGWSLAIVYKDSEMYSDITMIGIINVISFCMMIISVAFFVLYVNRLLLEPISELAGVQHRFGEGDLTARVEGNFDGEIGDLSRSFNEMADQLHERTACLEKEIVERQRIEEALRLDEARLKTLIELNQMTDASFEEISRFVLREGVRLTQSKFGYLAFINEDENEITAQTWFDRDVNEGADLDFKVRSMVRERVQNVLRFREIILNGGKNGHAFRPEDESNDYKSDRRSMDIPVFERGRIVSVVGVGNKEKEYDPPDARQLELLIQGMNGLVQRKRARQELKITNTILKTQQETSLDGILVVDKNGIMVLFNQRFVDLWNIPQEITESRDDSQALRVVLDQVVDPKAYQASVEYLYENADEKSWDEIEVKDGRTIERYSSPMAVSEGEYYGRVWYFRDITERKKAEMEREILLEQIKQQAWQMQQIMDTVPEGVLLLDENYRIVLANPVATQDLADLAGVGVGETLAFLGDQPLEEFKTSPPFELWRQLKARGRIFEAVARPIKVGPESGGWVLVTRDVTQERDLQQRAQQQERLAAIGQLAAGIAHDFNNIMAVVLLYSQMISRSANLPARVRERISTIIQQTKRASDLIQQILDFSRRAILDLHPIDLVPFLSDQVQLLRRTLPEIIEVRFIHQPSQFRVRIDPVRIQQAIMNLAFNARDAMPEGGFFDISMERIRVDACDRGILAEIPPGEWVQIKVEDSGTGITSDVLPHIFEPFYTTKAPGKGSGLGLSQVHGIVKQHGGFIDVASEVGRGTTFTLFFPLLISDPKPVVLPIKGESTPRGSGETILVVEDNVELLNAVVEGLELLNYRVLQAQNGRVALAVYQTEPVSLVLSDLVMPIMGGQALFFALKQQNPLIKMVIMTGHPKGEQVESMLSQGVADWLQKPVDLERLSLVLARLLKGEC
ncbi:MAG: response regulator [Anaerolineales bacterium]|nr:response regulator [Anaerolineales bacterium]